MYNKLPVYYISQLCNTKLRIKNYAVISDVIIRHVIISCNLQKTFNTWIRLFYRFKAKLNLF